MKLETSLTMTRKEFMLFLSGVFEAEVTAVNGYSGGQREPDHVVIKLRNDAGVLEKLAMYIKAGEKE